MDLVNILLKQPILPPTSSRWPASQIPPSGSNQYYITQTKQVIEIIRDKQALPADAVESNEPE
jgi:hypothetical protein